MNGEEERSKDKVGENKHGMGVGKRRCWGNYEGEGHLRHHSPVTHV